MSDLAPFASHPSKTRGRRHGEARDVTRGPRDDFQRDRDRIVHSIAFRRLRHKTQVFVAPDGDHFRVRLTHSIEVAQIARTIARALGLNEDLTEALALAHDLGHPPFGHSGEDALDAAMRDAGGFDHNAHTLRILTRIEAPYPRWAGLNLCWETLEGLAKHNGPVVDPPWALAEANAEMDLALENWPSLEAQVAAIADDIAYDNHDIDDGLRAGMLDMAALADVPFVARNWQAVRDRYPDVRTSLLQRELVRDQIGAMVNDVINASRAAIADIGVTSADDVRAAGRPLIGFSPRMRADEAALKRFLYASLYHSPAQKQVAAATAPIVTALFEAYAGDPARLPPGWQATLPAGEPGRSRHIGDFIAGMTDRYAIARHEEFIGPVELPEGF